MNTPTTAVPEAPPLAPPSPHPWPVEVLEFAAAKQIQPYLDPFLEATRRLFPTARALDIYVEQDVEIRDLRFLVFEVKVSVRDVPNFLEAHNRWGRELFRLCPAPLVFHFCLCLERVVQ